MISNEQVNTTKELTVMLGNHGLFEKPRRVRISHISNGLPNEIEFQELKLNFNKGKFPLQKADIDRKSNLIANFIAGKYTDA